MRVMAVVARPRQRAANVDWVGTGDRLGELLAAADFVVVACPLNEATRGMIGAAELKRMKPTAILINVARAEIVVEQDLFEALPDRRHRRRGARPVVPLPGVAATTVTPVALPVRDPAECPHDAALRRLDRRRLGAPLRRLRRNIDRLRRGEPLLNVVRAGA